MLDAYSEIVTRVAGELIPRVASLTVPRQTSSGWPCRERRLGGGVHR